MSFFYPNISDQTLQLSFIPRDQGNFSLSYITLNLIRFFWPLKTPEFNPVIQGNE